MCGLVSFVDREGGGAFGVVLSFLFPSSRC
jgi:hypothetical protein